MPIKKHMRQHYTSKVYKQARAKSRARAKGRCQHCKVKNGSRRGHTRIVLCTRFMDGNPTNRERSNMKQLCQACHFEAQRQWMRERQLTLFPV